LTHTETPRKGILYYVFSAPLSIGYEGLMIEKIYIKRFLILRHIRIKQFQKKLKGALSDLFISYLSAIY